MPIGVIIDPSKWLGDMPFSPICAGMPTPPATGCQPAAVFSQTSSLASEPPVPITDSTWVAPPTEFANHGVNSACAGGASQPVTAETAATQSRISSRRRGFRARSGRGAVGILQLCHPGLPFRQFGRGCVACRRSVEVDADHDAAWSPTAQHRPPRRPATGSVRRSMTSRVRASWWMRSMHAGAVGARRPALRRRYRRRHRRSPSAQAQRRPRLRLFAGVRRSSRGR